MDILLHMHDKDIGWNLDAPKLLISVTGGAQHFSLPFASRKAFKLGLAKTASSTKSWIITGGTDFGVMKLIDEAAAEWRNMSIVEFFVLGITTFGVLTERQKIEYHVRRIFKFYL